MSKASATPPVTREAMLRLLDVLAEAEQLARQLRADGACPWEDEDLQAVAYTTGNVGRMLELACPPDVARALSRLQGCPVTRMQDIASQGKRPPAELVAQAHAEFGD